MKFSSHIVQSYLVEQRLGRLATLTQSGLPHLVAVAFVNDQSNLYFSTFTKTKKVRNIRNDKNVAFIVDDSGGSAGWRYVTVEGNAHLITDSDEFDMVRSLLCEKYPVYLSDEWGIKVESHTLIRIEPKRVLTANLG
jgi:nitroimidazol reductase NimA-like FMN-containing flavoprotein (pyridoxamine 5'-phosphate oxidase superfamily)